MVNQGALEQVVKTVSRLLENGIPENVIYNKLLIRGCAEFEAAEVLRLAKNGQTHAAVATATAPPPSPPLQQDAEFQGMYISEAPAPQQQPPQPLPVADPSEQDDAAAYASTVDELQLQPVDEEDEYPYKADIADQTPALEPKTPIEWRKVYVVLLFLGGVALAAGVVTLIAWLAFRSL